MEFDTALALAGLEHELKLLRNRMNALLATVRDTQRDFGHVEALAEQLREALGEHMPPFKVHQDVKTATGAAFIVEQVERAFGQWMVLGRFPGGTRQYTYPADQLTADED